MAAELDRAVFERVLRQALASPEIREALRRGTHALGAEQLRTSAMLVADDIAAAASEEYGRFRRARAEAIRSAAPDGARSAARTVTGAGGGLLPAVAVLAPILAATAAAVFLLLGHGLRLAGARGEPARTLITAGWTAAAVAGAAVLSGAVAMLLTAARNRSVPPDGLGGRTGTRMVARSRDTWQQALLERGVMPYLRDRIKEAEAAGAPARSPRALESAGEEDGAPGPRRLPGPGFSSPDFSGPGHTSPAHPDPDRD